MSASSLNTSFASLVLALVAGPLQASELFTPLSRTYQCGMVGMAKSQPRVVRHDAERVVQTVMQNIVYPEGVESMTKEKFGRLVLSVIKVESNWNPLALSHANAMGIMQVTEVAAIHSRALCFQHIPVRDTPMMSDIEGNVKLGSCYLGYALREAHGDVLGALIMYNGGIRALTKHVRGASIPNESAQYSLRVLSNYNTCNAGGV